LYQIARILPQAVSYYNQTKSLEKENELQFLKLAEADLKDIKRLDEIKLWQDTAEENKPSWLQHPITITVIATLAFAAGLAIAL